MTVFQALKISNSHPVNVVYQPNTENEKSKRSVKRTEEEREYYEDAQICLNCTKKRCEGGEKCFRNAKARRGR